MKIALIQHTKTSQGGSTHEWLNSQGLEIDHFKLFEKIELPKPNSFDHLIICGGSMNVDQTALFPWLIEEKKLIQDALSQDKKILGLCLGGQLLAEAMGAKVGPHPHWEVGWHDVELLANSGRSLPSWPKKTLKVFQFHGYAFETPKEAQSFATNENCQHQGFIYQDQAIGMQFHPETTREWAIECSEEKKLPSAEKGFKNSVQTRAEILAGLEYQNDLKTWYFALLNRFLLNSK